ncbi:MAG: ATP-binding protein [Clostridia bacterium]|nr:ATP-binding protein [Clostridia bacterium]
MADRLTFTIPGKPEYATMIRLAIGTVALEAGFSIEDAEDIKVATAEACKNICCHGNDSYPDSLKMECIVEDGKIELFIEDIGEGSSFEKVNPICMDCPKEGDLSLAVIQSIMDKVEVSTHAQGRKFIRMTKSNG